MRWIEVAPNDTAIAALRHVLDEPEQARADRFRFAEDRDSYIAAHALLRVMLAEQSQSVAAGAWRFRTAPGGKPEIEPSLGHADLKFSLSHTRGMVACAVGRTHDLGVDVEDCARSMAAVDVAKRYFATAEADLIADLPAHARNAMFFRIWTLKEAYLKAVGQGITAPLGDFAFHFNDPQISIQFLTQRSDLPESWQFAEIRPGPQHQLALAVRRPVAAPIPVDAHALSSRECLDWSGDVT